MHQYKEIHSQLKRYGITKIALFPELQSIADEITQQVIAERIWLYRPNGCQTMNDPKNKGQAVFSACPQYS